MPPPHSSTQSCTIQGWPQFISFRWVQYSTLHIQMSISGHLSFQISRSLLTMIHPPIDRDMGSSPTCYDFLLSSGTHKQSRLDLPELGTSLSYGPGTLVAVSGKVLLHRVKWWEGGERVCIAHFTKDAVHTRLGLERPQWPRQQTYLQLLGK